MALAPLPFRGVDWKASLAALLLMAAWRGPAASAVEPAEFDFASPPEMTALPEGPPPFDYLDVGAKIPNYVPSDVWGTQGEPLTQMQEPLPAAESMRRMSTPVGFHVELYADETTIGGKPLAMAWDERGRLWLAESVDYPNELQPPGEGRDRIRILEDRDGDGRAESSTVFAESLSIPTSLAFTRGGVLVHNGTETLFLRDTDGDDQADERRVVLSTWAMRDTHGGPSNMQYGLDNWIWGMQGYNKSTIRAGGEAVTFAQGFHRFRPDGSAIEFLRSTNNNTWGLGISEEGIVFGSTANGNPSEYMPIPNRYYERVRGWTPQLTLRGIAVRDRILPITDKVRQVDHHGRHTAAAGHALYTARAYPRAYWNRTAFVCEPTGHLVGTFVLERDGAGFRSNNPLNLLASDDEWTAPTMAEVGPDGCVWVIDWYNYIVQHNPTPKGFQTGKGAAYESDLRDKTHGRIYRIVPDDMAAAASHDLSQATPTELVATLSNDNLFWRRHAQRLLVERGELDVLPQLAKLVQDTSVDEIGLNVGAIHALWTMHGLGALNDEHPDELAAAVAALEHPSPGVRRNAVQVLPAGNATVEAILAADLLRDQDDQVRLAALLGLADQPENDAAGAALAEFLADQVNVADRWLRDALTSAASAHAGAFLPAVAANDNDVSREARGVVRIVADHYARTQSGDAAGRLVASLGECDPQLAGAIVAGLQAGWPEGQALPMDDAGRAAIERLLGGLSLEDQAALAQLAMRSGSPEWQPLVDGVCDALLQRAEDTDLSAAERGEAVALAVATQPESLEVVERVIALVSPQTPPEEGAALIAALRGCRAPEVGQVLLEAAATFAPSVRAAALDLLVSRPLLAAALLDAIEQGDVLAGELSLVQKRQLERLGDRALAVRARDLLSRAGGRVNEDRRQVLAEFADVARAEGDASRGKAVFTKNCAVCHKLRGEGAAVGPDLSGMAVHGRDELLIQILDPNRDVEGNYISYTALLADGLMVSGLLAGESATAVELIDAEGKRRPLLREDIDELSRSGMSLMPEGFEKQLTREELADLLAYLTDTGGFLPLDLRRVATASSAQGMFNNPESTVERLIFDEWGVKLVEGVPFYPIDPQDGRVRNVIMLRGPHGRTAPTMPRSVELACGAAAKAVHLLSGVSGWGYPATPAGGVSLVVRLRYADGAREDHPLKNGEAFVDYLSDAEAEGSKLAFDLGAQQLRYIKITPGRGEPIEAVELIKGDDQSAPLVMAVTVEVLR